MPPHPTPPVQDDLFAAACGADGAPAEADPATASRTGIRARPRAAAAVEVQAATPDSSLQALAAALADQGGGRLHLGTSSWHFPGWAGQVYADAYPSALLSRQGLRAYSQHPLLRAVSLDRAFYRPLEATTYAALAGQVPHDFRFVVKAAAMVCDAAQRDPADGRALRDNPLFLDPAAALEHCVRPAVDGLGERLGALVFQLSPLPSDWLRSPARLLARLDALWSAVVPALPAGSVAALELRDPALLGPALAASLRSGGARYCLGLHDRLPAIEQQLPMLRATWPGPLVCRWNLQRGWRYAAARDRFAPFDRIQAPDPATRRSLARVVAGTLAGGFPVLVTINNKAEGSAPASVVELAQACLRAMDPEPLSRD